MIFINDLNANAGGLISKFAGTINIGGVRDSVEGCQRIQWDLDLLYGGTVAQR